MTDKNVNASSRITTTMPSIEAPSTNGVLSANDNITRFNPPSRVLTPLEHTLFHNKTRCFV